MGILIGREVEVLDLGPLTPREAEALLWVAEGKTAWEAGTILGITEATANSHITKAAEKLNASNRPHLVARAFCEGILRPVHIFVLLAVLVNILCTDGDDLLARVKLRRKREEYELVMPDDWERMT